MTVRRGLAAGLILGPACCWAFATSASAQDASATPASTLELQQVTVTANFIRPGGQSALKMNVPVKDVPFALVDYSQSFMKAVDTTQLTDLYGYMSGVQRAGPSGYDITIRGFTSSSTDPNSVLMDGLPGLPARTASPETSDLERVEIVKGPSSVLYGQAQPGGFINLITKKPQRRYQTTATLRANTYDGAGISFGRDNGYTAIVDTTGPLVSSGRLLGRAIVQYDDNQSFRAFALNKDFMFAPGVTWLLSARTKATLLLEYRKGNDSWDQGLVAPALNSTLIAPITTRYQNPEDKRMEKGETATLLLHHAFSDSLSWDFNLRAVHTEDLEVGFDTGAVLKNLVTLSRKDRDQDNNHHDNFLDTSLTDLFHTGPIAHRLLAGLTVGQTIEDYNRIRLFATPLLNIDIYDPVIGYNDVTPPAASEPPQAHSWASATSYGAYGTDLITFASHWKGVVGVRYEDVEQLQRELRLPNTGDQRASFNSIIPMGGLIYQPTGQLSLYASYSTSYVPPPANATPVDPTRPLQAQDAVQQEVGAKFASASGRTNATISVFNIKETNVIQVIGITGLYDQIGATRSRGVELELDTRPTGWWQLSANYALLDAKVTDDVVTNRIGSMTLNSPRNSASVLSRMQLPGKLNSLGWMFGVVYRSQRVGLLPTAANANEFVMPGYTTVDTGIYYSADTWDASLKVGNLLDKRYYQSAFSDVRITPGDPREFSLTLNKTFN
jgi:iron complex outermembrane receptor protein